jgi:hypothetical protein
MLLLAIGLSENMTSASQISLLSFIILALALYFGSVFFESLYLHWTNKDYYILCCVLHKDFLSLDDFSSYNALLFCFILNRWLDFSKKEVQMANKHRRNAQHHCP